LAKKISRIGRRFAAYARLKNKKSTGEITTRQQQITTATAYLAVKKFLHSKE
jgi:hypothetical protein